MLIKILDSGTMGADTPLDILSTVGEIKKYNQTTPDELYERIKDADVIILNKVKIDEAAIAAAKHLKLICVFATGYDAIDIKAAKKYNVAVCNVPGYSTESVTLFTVTTVLALVTHLREYNNFITSGEYSKSNSANRLIPVYHEASGKTWGIIGYGNIGKSVAKVAKALGAKVIVYTRTPREDAVCVDFETLCRESDIITIHCPLNNETKGIIDEKAISLMKPDVTLVNVARGAVIDEEAMARAIENKRIGAFGSDVYSIEPFNEAHPFYHIMSYPNVLLTPHAAWGSYESRLRCTKAVLENIKAFFNGESKNRVEL